MSIDRVTVRIACQELTAVIRHLESGNVARNAPVIDTLLRVQDKLLKYCAACEAIEKAETDG